MNKDYLDIQITKLKAKEIALELYNIQGEVVSLPGEFDFNFRITTKSESYILKVSRPAEDKDYIDFQQEILKYVENSKVDLMSPKTFPDVNGNLTSEVRDDSGKIRKVRLLSWVDGRVWSSVHPIRDELLYSLGEETGKLTSALQGFNHQKAVRKFDWDLSQSIWTEEYLHLFDEEHKEILQYFQNRFKDFQCDYKNLRKSVVHNDANDNNVIVSNDLLKPKVKSIIDYGDSVYTQTINDVAITMAYAMMDKPDPLSAALPVLKGYNSQFTLKEKELEFLYTLIAMRLTTTVTKSAINKQKEPDNEYLLISEKPAWELLKKWKDVDSNIAFYSFRSVCEYTPHPNEEVFRNSTSLQNINLNALFPTINFSSVYNVDMSVSSLWLGHEKEYNDLNYSSFKIRNLQQDNPDKIIAGGYSEIRPFYDTKAFQKEGNSGIEFRSMHLGVDFWLEVNTPIHALFESQVYSLYNNDALKDYGNTIILKHETEEGIVFYSLYGHLAAASLELHKEGDMLKKGDLVAFIGNPNENGSWPPHLHFQLMLDLLGNKHDFPGVCFPGEKDVWKSICPNPNMIFKNPNLNEIIPKDNQEILTYRKKYLGKSLSISYQEPLKMVRGAGQYLMDSVGRKYLDTVNNVAHVGHEHPRVLVAGQKQMSLLNTNTRYLHENINDFAAELLSTFPKELSVVHFVNSGSEANELALRMTKAVTGQKDMIAVEIGYHGNANACIDISSYKFDGKGGKGAPEHTHIVPLPDAFRGIYTGDDTGKKYASHIQEQIKQIKSQGRNVAGFICESIVSCGGQIELPKDYLETAYQFIRDEGGICISDEVQVGCGRVGSAFWGFQLHNVIPDVVTIGKPIGNGHPLAAVVCTKEVAEAFANGMEYFNTFGGNPVSCAIGKEVLQVIQDEKLQENALNVGGHLKKELKNLQSEFPIIGDIRGQGLFLGIELVDEQKNPETEKASYLANRMKDFGILMSTDGKDNNVLKIKPPMVFSIENADELISRISSVLKEDFIQY